MKTKWHFTAHPIGIACVLAALFFVPLPRLVAVLCAIAAHEAAHLIAIKLCKVKHCAVEWTLLGFVAQADGFSTLPVMQRLLIAISGLLSSAAFTIVLYPLAGQHRFIYLLFTANLAILLVNALPILPLDGGRVLLALSASFGCEIFTKKVLLILSYLSAVSLTGLGMYGVLNGILNPSLLILGPYLAYAAKQYSLSSGAEIAYKLEKHSSRQENGVYQIASWAIVGEATPLSLMRVFQRCPQEKFVLFHTIDPKSGTLVSIETQQEMAEKLLDNK